MMKPNRIRAALIAGALLCAYHGGAAEPGDPTGAGFENRLLGAELMEVSAGELQGAMAVYKSLASDPGAPESVVARALLYQARCYRKLGQVVQARTLLEELLRAYPSQREVARLANRFLGELRTGKTDNAAFDWLNELENNPEIQARVFDLVMDLANTTRANDAMRQLLALGPIAFPVMERMIEVSSDGAQRHDLALVFAHQGRYEFLPVLLETVLGYEDGALMGFMHGLPRLDADQTLRFLEAVDAIPDQPGTTPYLAGMRLWAGGATDLESELRRREQFRFRGLPASELVTHLIETQPAGADLIAERILDDALDFNTRELYADCLRARAPSKLLPKHIVSLAETLKKMDGSDSVRKKLTRHLMFLLHDEEFEAVLGLLPSEGIQGLECVTEQFRQVSRYYETLTGLSGTPPGWARLLRAEGEWNDLFLFAEHNDQVIPEVMSVLREASMGGWEGYVRERRRNDPPSLWKPSAAYRQAMIGALAFQNPFARAYALEVLSHDTDSIDEALVMEVLKCSREDDDPHLRELALLALMRWSPELPEHTDGIVQAFADEYDRRLASNVVPEAYLKSPANLPYIGVNRKQDGGRQAVRPPRLQGAPEEPIRYADSLDWMFPYIGGTRLVNLYPAVLELAEAENRIAFHQMFFAKTSRSIDSQQSEALRAMIGERLLSLKNQDLVAYWVTTFSDPAIPGFGTFLQCVAADPAFDLDVRWAAHTKSNPPHWSGYDWPGMIQDGDPLAERVFRETYSVLSPRRRPSRSDTLFWNWVSHLEKDQRAAIYDAAFASTHSAVRQSLIANYPLDWPHLIAVFKEFIADPDQNIRLSAAARLRKSTRADAGPLFTELLGDSDALIRWEALQGVARFTDPTSIQPLVKLLDDPDLRVREAAADALRNIRRGLEEKGEWKRLVETIP